MNQTSTVQPKRLQKLAYELFQSRRRREKVSHLVIGISLKNIDKEQFLSTIPKFGNVDWTGGVKRDRGRRCKSKFNSAVDVPSQYRRMENGLRIIPISEIIIGNGLDSRSV